MHTHNTLKNLKYSMFQIGIGKNRRQDDTKIFNRARHAVFKWRQFGRVWEAFGERSHVGCHNESEL